LPMMRSSFVRSEDPYWFAPPQICRSAGWGEELQGDAIRIAEANARDVAPIFDPVVLDAELVEPAGPALELGAVGAAEGDMVEADAELAEPLIGRGLGVLVQPQQGGAEQVHGVVEVGIGVLVQHRLGIEQRLIPGDADRQIADC
jgi:hypothetical protein